MTLENGNRSNGPPVCSTEPSQKSRQPQREPGNAPEAEPGNEWMTPEAERPPKREEGIVSDPDRYATGPLSLQAEGPRYLGAGTVSNPDF